MRAAGVTVSPPLVPPFPFPSFSLHNASPCLIRQPVFPVLIGAKLQGSGGIDSLRAGGSWSHQWDKSAGR
eukprot:2698225-Rhodomonas_salina.1